MTWQVIIPGVALVVAVAFAVWAWLTRRPPDRAFLLLQQQLTALHDQLRVSLEKTHETVGSRLDNVGKTVGDRLDNAARVVRDLDQRMGKVEEATRRVFEVGQDIASLQEILRAPKLRGSMGEQLLADLLAQMLPRESYELQYEFRDGERVDAIIRTAHGFVSVDAKFPLENFQRLVAAKTDDERRSLRKQFTADVKKHVDAIAQKYIRAGEGTFEFALLYVPAENVYYEIITREEGTAEGTSIATYALKKNVVPVSPNTLYAYLSTILMGLRGMRVERFAKEILADMGRVRKELSFFVRDFELVGTHLAAATSSFGKAEKRLTKIDDRLSTFESPDDPSVLAPAREEIESYKQ